MTTFNLIKMRVRGALIRNGLPAPVGFKVMKDVQFDVAGMNVNDVIKGILQRVNTLTEGRYKEVIKRTKEDLQREAI